MAKILVGLCSYKGPDVHCFATHLELWMQFGRLAERGEHQFGVAWEVGNSLIGQARDRCCEHAVKNDFDYVFMYDDDMRFAKDILERLLARNVPVIGALAFTGRQPVVPVLYKFHKEWDFKKQTEKVDIQPWMDYPRDDLVRVDAIGTGVVLIKTEVLKQISQPWFYGSLSCGEDILFAWKCRKAGIPIYCDTSVKTLHRPNEPLFWHGEEFYDALNRNPDIQKLQRTCKVPTILSEVGGIPVPNLCDQ